MKRQQGALDRSVLGAGTRERARLNRRRHHGVALPAVAISWKARPAQERGLGSHARRATVASAIPNARRSHNLCYISGLWVSRQKLASYFPALQIRRLGAGHGTRPTFGCDQNRHRIERNPIVRKPASGAACRCAGQSSRTRPSRNCISHIRARTGRSGRRPQDWSPAPQLAQDGKK